jgi:hypothetical protein
VEENLTKLVLDYFGSFKRAFTLKEVFDFAGSEADPEIIERALLNDYRFVSLEEDGERDHYFIPRKSLLKWLLDLNLKLSFSKKRKLLSREIATLLSTLRTEGRWKRTPEGVLQIGSDLGLIGLTEKQDQFVFPLAHLLSFMPIAKSAIDALKEEISEKNEAKTVAEGLSEDCLQEWLSKFDERIRYIILARAGLLTPKKMTLGEIGRSLGLSRERIRQLENKFYKQHKFYPRAKKVAKPVAVSLIKHIISRKGSLIFNLNSKEAGILRILSKCFNIPFREFSEAGIFILGSSLDLSLFCRLYKKEMGIELNLIITLLDQAIASSKLEEAFLTQEDLTILVQGIIGAIGIYSTREESVYLALKTIGRPAHYSEVTEVYCSLFPNKPITERAVHAILGRGKFGIVWAGLKGIYALKEWGYERPSETLFDTVQEIVTDIFQKTGRPVHINAILGEVSKKRKLINPSSVIMAATLNPKLKMIGSNLFLPIE